MKINHFSLKLLTAICLLSFCSCSVRISDFDQYQKMMLPNYGVTIAEQSKAKVVVFNFNDAGSSYAKHAQLGQSLALEVENTLSDQKIVELIDRKVANKLNDEIALAEMNNAASSYRGPRLADYAIIGVISKSGYQKGVSGSLKIYELPSMKVMENFEFSGIRSDGRDAIDNISSNLKRFFSRKAYILEKRALGNKVIFKISQGHKDGVNKSSKFDIVRETNYHNVVTDKTKIDEIIIASGRVSRRINSDSSWVVLDKKEYNDKIRIGDAVVLKHKRGFLKKIVKYSKNIAVLIADRVL